MGNIIDCLFSHHHLFSMDSQLQLSIRQILHHHGFYHLPTKALNDILFLLEYPPSSLPSFIEQYSIRGFQKLVKTYKQQKMAAHFRGSKYKQISQNIKQYVILIASEIKKVLVQIGRNQLKNQQIDESRVKTRNQEKQERRALRRQLSEKNELRREELMEEKQKEESQGDSEEEDSDESDKPQMVDAEIQTDLNCIKDDYITFEREPNASYFIDDEAEYKIYLKKQKKRQKYLQKVQNMSNNGQMIKLDPQNKLSKEKQSCQDPFFVILSHRQQQRQEMERENKEVESKQEKKSVKDEIINFTLDELNLQPQMMSPEPSQVPELSQMIPQLPFGELARPSSFQNCRCKNQQKDLPFFNCIYCKNNYHYLCLNTSEHISTNKQCPQCIIKRLYPPHQIQEVIFQRYFTDLSQLFQAQINAKPYEYFCSQVFRKYEIELRCLRVSSDPSDSKQFTWPNNAVINVNGITRYLIEPLSQEVFRRKRNDSLVVITPQIFFESEKGLPNLSKVKIQIKTKALEFFSYNHQNTFLIGAYFVKKLTFQELLQEKMSIMKTTPKHFYADLFKGQSEEIQIQKITWSLKDPFTKQLIDTPVRGSYCSHLQCFDLTKYLKVLYYLKSNCWKCPICNKISRVLLQDPIQKSIISKVKQLNINPKEITYTSEGKISIKLMEEEEEVEEQIKKIEKKPRKRQRNTIKKITKQQVYSNEIKDQSVSCLKKNFCFSES